ncbi:DnaQ like exonuclease [Pandoravirus salinus]|uniref:DnaQ like exonuclease n=1 Tax=Pandoravirus salinus TaxID=1349410 RepID=S4W2Z7_9VIRU|nr:DnaQ like exonuclease [Pandoravirus salinus]AGO84595.1 DnaQ like exonuclease [Pandoravirus salinus]
MATTQAFPPGLAPGGDQQQGPPWRDPEPLNQAVARALERRPRGLPIHAIDPFVRWSTGSKLSEWVRTADMGSCVFGGPSHPSARAMRPESRADLLRRLPCVGAVDRIAGLSVVYPAASAERLREHAPPTAPGQRTLCASLGDNATKSTCGGVTVTVVDSIEACRNAVHDMRRRGTAIALDCEGTSIVRLNGVSPGIALIQMTPRGGPCYLFDMCRTETTRSGRALMKHGGLGALLSDPSVTKVVHDAREDARALAVAYRCALEGVFDTQAAHMKAEGNADGPRPSLNAVLAAYGLGANHHKDAMRAVYPFDLWAWHRRPLPDWMVEYAVCDVALLLALYDRLIARCLSSSPPPPWRLVPSIPPLCGWTVVVASSAAAPRRCTTGVAAGTLRGASDKCWPPAVGDSTKGASRRRHRHGAPAISQ